MKATNKAERFKRLKQVWTRETSFWLTKYLYKNNLAFSMSQSFHPLALDERRQN